MVTFGYFELYATFLGWFFFGEFARFFVESGLILIIPIILYVKTYSDAKTGQHTKSGSGSAVNQMALDSIKTALFLVLFFLPFVTLNPTQVNFEIEDGQVVNLDTNQSTFQGRFSTSDFENVRVPIVWSGLMNISSGINTFFMSRFPDAGNLREEIMTLERTHITDPLLSKEVNRFHDECYSKALHYYKKQELHQNPIEINPDDGDTPFWPGSETMLEIYGRFNVCTTDCPPVYRADKPVSGFSVDPRIDVEPEYSQGGESIGRPLCSVWWNSKLKDNIYDEAARNGVDVGYFAFLKDIVGLSDEEVRNVIIKETMTNQQSVEVTNPNMQYADHGRVSGGYIQGFTSAIGVEIEGIKTGSQTYQIVRSLPILQGLLLMVLYFSLPILMMLSKLSLRSFAAVIIGFFAIRFLTVLWHFAYWIDEFFLASSIPEIVPGGDGIFTGFDGSLLDKTTLDFILILGYLVIPLIFYIVLGWVGFKAYSAANHAIGTESRNSARGSNTVTNAGVGKLKGGMK